MTFAEEDEAQAGPGRNPAAMVGAAALVLAAAVGSYLHQSSPKASSSAPAPLVDVRALSPAKPSDDAVPAAELAPIELPKKLPKEWRFRGAVYDLLTLKGVAGCSLIFTNDLTSGRFETSTDDAGNYRMILPPLAEGGYTLKIAQPGYLASFYSSAKHDYRNMPAGARRTAARGLAGAVPQAALLSAPGAAPVINDFFLAPAS